MTNPILRPDRPLLMLVTEPHTGLADIVRAAVDGGVDVVQWRDKRDPALVDWLNDAEVLLAAIADRVPMVVNGSGDAFLLAFLSRSRGVHLPESGPWSNWSEVRKDWSGPKSPDFLIGYSIHSVDMALKAEEAGASYVVAGTIFASTSHPDTPPAGLDFLAEVCRAVSIPVIAIGGVTPANVGDCLRAGAAGVAVLSPIMRADDPRTAAMAYRTALDAAIDRG